MVVSVGSGHGDHTPEVAGGESVSRSEIFYHFPLERKSREVVGCLERVSGIVDQLGSQTVLQIPPVEFSKIDVVVGRVSEGIGEIGMALVRPPIQYFQIIVILHQQSDRILAKL